MATKAKSAALIPAPKSLTEVNSLLGEIGEIDRELLREKQRLEALFQRVRKDSEERFRASIAKRTAAVKAIGRFARKNRDKILPDDRKSIELALGTIGWRFDPWKVVVTAEEETIITWLQVNRMPRFLRQKVELNREQLLAEKPEHIPNLRFEQKERFFVEPKTEPPQTTQSSVVSLVRVA